MKKILILILAITLTFNTSIYATNVDSSENTTVVQSTLAKKLKDLLDNDIFTAVFDYKKINEVIKDAISNISEEEKEEVKKLYPEVSLDLSNFDTEYSTYNWLAKYICISLKEEIERDLLTQERIDKIIGTIKLLGQDTGDIKIKKGLTDAEIEAIAEKIVDLLASVVNSNMLDMLGVDLSDPNTVKEIKDCFASASLF